jgi:hypothetical protein
VEDIARRYAISWSYMFRRSCTRLLVLFLILAHGVIAAGFIFVCYTRDGHVAVEHSPLAFAAPVQGARAIDSMCEAGTSSIDHHGPCLDVTQLVIVGSHADHACPGDVSAFLPTGGEGSPSTVTRGSLLREGGPPPLRPPLVSLRTTVLRT